MLACVNASTWKTKKARDLKLYYILVYPLHSMTLFATNVVQIPETSSLEIKNI